MDNKLVLTLTLICIIIIYLIVTGVTAQLTAQKYIINIYMYVLLAIILVGLSWAFLDNYNTDSNNSFFDSGAKHLALIVIFFASFIASVSIPKEHVLLNHTAWALFIVTIGFMTYISYKNNIKKNKMTSVLISLMAIIATMSYIAYSQPLDTFRSWEKPLLYALCALIVVEVGDLIYTSFMRDTFEFNARVKLYGWAGLIIFSLLMVTGTQRLLKNADLNVVQCQGNSQSKCVDYPKESLNTILNVANLFNSVTMINS